MTPRQLRQHKKWLTKLAVFTSISVNILCIAGLIWFLLFQSDASAQEAGLKDKMQKLFAETGDKIERGLQKNKEKPTEYFIEMEGLSQTDIPTGCEAVSTVMALRYAGVEIGPADFILEYLPMEYFYHKGGKLYGPDPHKAFAGSPFDTESLGCFSQVILDALDKMKQADYPGMDGVDVKNVSGTELSELADNYVSEGTPVVIWATSSMAKSYPGMTYSLADGSSYTWQANEHCMVLCGYDKDFYYLMDPQTDGKRMGYDKALVEERYGEMGREALVIERAP